MSQKAYEASRSGTDAYTWCRWITVFGAIPVSAYILAAYSSFTRPIWIDEFVHYALGSHRSTAEAWQSISDTIPTLNHGQTGIHMLLDYWLLQQFGASAFFLRLPSLVAAAFLLFSLVQIALRLRFSPLWTFLLLAVVFCQRNLMYFAGEARPYMMLAAAVTGTLAYYLVPVGQRTRTNRICGGIAIGMGVLFHPFFPVYWLALAIYTWAIQGQSFRWRTFLPGFIRHCDAGLSVPAAVTCLVLAKFTWLRGSPDFHLDPFQWIRSDGLFYTFAGSHFQFLREAYLYITVPIALGVGILAALIPSDRRNAVIRRLIPPVALLALALGLSLFFSAVSYYREYWVLPRQWVASMALCCVGFVWLAKEVVSVLSQKLRAAAVPVAGVAVAVALYLSVMPVHRLKVGDIGAMWQFVTFDGQRERGNTPVIDKEPASNDEWVALANENIAGGGPVWPVFRRFYGRND